MKVCINCDKLKVDNDFYYHPKNKDGRFNRCKKCAITRQTVTNNEKAIPGVYCLFIGEYFYLGSTNNLYAREQFHKSTLQHGKCRSPKIQAAYDKCGTMEFKTILITREQRYYEAELIKEHLGTACCLNSNKA